MLENNETNFLQKHIYMIYKSLFTHTLVCKARLKIFDTHSRLQSKHASKYLRKIINQYLTVN